VNEPYNGYQVSGVRTHLCWSFLTTVYVAEVVIVLLVSWDMLWWSG